MNPAASGARGRPLTDFAAADIETSDQGKAAPIVLSDNDAARPVGVREFSSHPVAAISSPRGLALEGAGADDRT